MVYGRTIGGQTLDFEPSGALLQASLVMRDRQTDSWWSIMSSGAIGGPLEGSVLPELPVGEKTSWRAWRAKHPGTLVLSVDGAEHVADDPYADYLATGRTFRDLPNPDERLPAKEPVFAFRLDGRPWAIPHRAVEGGRLVGLPGDRRRLLLFRERGASVEDSSEAWLVAPAVAANGASVAALRAAAQRGEPGFAPVQGFDTFWYTWAGVNRASGLLR